MSKKYIYNTKGYLLSEKEMIYQSIRQGKSCYRDFVYQLLSKKYADKDIFIKTFNQDLYEISFDDSIICYKNKKQECILSDLIDCEVWFKFYIEETYKKEKNDFPEYKAVVKIIEIHKTDIY